MSPGRDAESCGESDVSKKSGYVIVKIQAVQEEKTLFLLFVTNEHEAPFIRNVGSITDQQHRQQNVGRITDHQHCQQNVASITDHQHRQQNVGSITDHQHRQQNRSKNFIFRKYVRF